MTESELNQAVELLVDADRVIDKIKRLIHAVRNSTGTSMRVVFGAGETFDTRDHDCIQDVAESMVISASRYVETKLKKVRALGIKPNDRVVPVFTRQKAPKPS